MTLQVLLAWALAMAWLWLMRMLPLHPRRQRQCDCGGQRCGAKRGKKPEWVIRQLVLLQAHLPDAGCRCLALRFNRVFAHREMSVSKSFVYATLREHAHAVWLARKAIRNATPRTVAVNHCWGVDLTGRADESGKVHAILGVLDHGSRRVLGLSVLPSKYGWTLLGNVCLVIAEFGKPRSIRRQ